MNNINTDGFEAESDLRCLGRVQIICDHLKQVFFIQIQSTFYSNNNFCPNYLSIELGRYQT